MRMEIIPGKPGFEAVHETPEDWRSLVAVCQRCGRVLRYGPEEEFTVMMKRESGTSEAEFMAIEIESCRLCDRSIVSKSGECIGAMLGLLPAG